MDVATMKKDLENQIGDINKELENIYLPHDAVLILLGKRTAFGIALKLVDSLRLEQKPAEWSEEDERILNELLDHCNTENATWYNFLKSLRPSWKPSEEQMYILNWVANILLNHNGIVEEEASKKLQSLYNDLKQL